MLEFGDKYIRVWNYGVYTGIEVATLSQLVIHLRFKLQQSGDAMFICSGIQFKHYLGILTQTGVFEAYS